MRKALAAVCADVREGAPDQPTLVAAPGSTEEAAAIMRVAAEHELAVVVRGGGSRLSWGTPPSRCDLVIDMSRMAEVVEHAAGDLVARLQAGARMDDVAAVLARAGQEIALDVPAGATVGGVVASGLAGPRRLRYGTPRDLLIGITIVRADGTVAKSGGKVVKNVAGYDLGKLFAGSAGTLGLITEATFRLHPLPGGPGVRHRRVRRRLRRVRRGRGGGELAARRLRGRAEPAGTRRAGPGRRAARGVRRRGRGAVRCGWPTCSATARSSAEPPAWWPGAPQAGPGETLVRVSCWVAALGRVLDAIETADGETGVSPAVAGSAGAGVLYVRLAQQDRPEPVARFVAKLRAALAGERGGVAVLTAPVMVRKELDAGGGMNAAVPGLALMRAVKDQFDPGHRMAPGRFPEGT